MKGDAEPLELDAGSSESSRTKADEQIVFLCRLWKSLGKALPEPN